MPEPAESASSTMGTRALVIPLKDLPAFIDALPGPGQVTPAAEAPRAEVISNDLDDTDPRDVRGIGVRGAYPQINWGSLSAEVSLLLKNAYSRSAAARILCDRIPADTWGEWLTLKSDDEALVERLNEVFRNPTARPGDRPMWWYYERADKLAMRDGMSLIYYTLEDRTGDRTKEPVGVRGIRLVQVVTRERITGKTIEQDPKNPRFGSPVMWRIQLPMDDASAGSVEINIHSDRVQLFLPDPDEDDPWNGRSPLWTIINYVEWLENLNWSTAEAYFKQASPWVVAEIPAGVSIDKEERKSLKTALTKLVNSNVQRIDVKGISVKLLTAPLSDPMPHWEIAIRNLAMATGLPKQEMTGDSPGELMAARENAKRWASRMGKRQEQYAGPIVYDSLERFVRWNVKAWVRPDPLPVDFSWNPLVKPDAKEEALRQVQLGIARRQYRESETPLPAELEYEESDQFAKLPPPPSRAFGTAPVTEAASKAGPAMRDVAGVVHRFEERVNDVFEAGFRRVLRAIQQRLGGTRSEAVSDDVAVYLLTNDLTDELAQAIEEELERAAIRGAQETFLKSGKEPVFEFVDNTTIREFKTIGDSQSRETSERIAASVRDEIADGLSKGESVQEISRRVRTVFDSTRVDANRIARTEAMRGYNRGTESALRSMGQTHFRWRTAPSARDEACLSRSGRVFELGDRENIPPDASHPQCNCWMEAVLEGVS